MSHSQNDPDYIKGVVARIRTYNSSSKSRVLDEEFYGTDNGDGTYDDLVQKDTYSYNGSKLISVVKNYYDSSDTIYKTETFTYFEADNGKKTIEKVVVT